jgi:hypothetical protein
MLCWLCFLNRNICYCTYLVDNSHRMIRIILSLSILLSCAPAFSQNWKLEKEKDSIKVYTASSASSNYKSVKVECTLRGNYNKLISILTNVESFKEWIYNTRTSKLLKKNSALDFVYYSETHMPWPLSNRDAIIHMQIKTDSLPKYLLITGKSVDGLLPEFPSRVRVPHYSAMWKVTMPAANTIRIYYTVDVDPGGSIPGWMANMFADKGPYGSFSNLAQQLQK